jgi:hypothetical protein
MPTTSSPDWKAKRRTQVLDLLKHWRAIVKERCARCMMFGPMNCPGYVGATEKVKDLEEELQELGGPT